MTSYNTGNPLGSSDPRDLYDNAENLDTAVNDTSRDTWSDRLGRSRKTMTGMEREFNADQDGRDSRFNAFIASSGYQFLGDYAAGIEITEYNQIVRDADGEFWRLSGSTALPYITTSAALPVEGAFVSVGDAYVRQQIEANVLNTAGALNVKAFGAVGDGTTDDTPSIQAAVDAASAAGGGVVFLPAGVYKITEPLMWRSRVSLVGVGAGISVIKMVGVLFDAIKNITAGPPYGNDETVIPLSDCRFENFEIDGSGLTHTEPSVSGKGIFINFMRRARFRNLYIHHTIGTGLGCDFHEDSVIESCVVNHCGRNYTTYEDGGIGQSGIGIGSGWKETDYLTISNCFTNFNGNYGVFVELQTGEQNRDYNSQGARIVNCYARGNRIGFGNRSSGGTTFIGCQSIDSSLDGFEISNSRWSYNTLSMCRSERSGRHGFHIAIGSPYDILVGCHAIDSGANGFHYTGNFNVPGQDTVGHVGLTLETCKAIRSGGRGIYLFCGVDITQGDFIVSNCVSSESGREGMIASRIKSLTLRDSLFDSSTEEGVLIESSPVGSRAFVDSCVMEMSGTNGIKVTSPGEGSETVIRGCSVLSNGTTLPQTTAHAILYSTSHPRNSLHIDDCIIKNKDGLEIQGQAINTTMTGADSSAYITNNDLRDAYSARVIRSGVGKVIARGNKGYNWEKVTHAKTSVSPVTRPIDIVDSIYSINGSDLSVTVSGVVVATNVNSYTAFVPAGEEISFSFSGAVSYSLQRL